PVGLWDQPVSRGAPRRRASQEPPPWGADTAQPLARQAPTQPVLLHPTGPVSQVVAGLRVAQQQAVQRRQELPGAVCPGSYCVPVVLLVCFPPSSPPLPAPALVVWAVPLASVEHRTCVTRPHLPSPTLTYPHLPRGPIPATRW